MCVCAILRASPAISAVGESKDPVAGHLRVRQVEYGTITTTLERWLFARDTGLAVSPWRPRIARGAYYEYGGDFCGGVRAHVTCATAASVDHSSRTQGHLTVCGP
jgi:hypothetical protein